MPAQSPSPATSLTGRQGVSKASRQSKRIQACTRCHARKVKCSGGLPCNNCSNIGITEQCTYNEKTRLIKVSERYLEQVLAENEKLKRGNPNPGPHEDPDERAISSEGTATPIPAVSNPVMEERAWFIVSDSTRLPIYIAEAACPAFATRFRQSLNTTGTSISHIPRTNYVSDEQLLSFTVPQPPWPSKIDALLFVKVAVSRINRGYHVLLYGPTMAKLNQAYSNSEPLRSDEVCVLFALFALGQVYSSGARRTTMEDFPGLYYFKYACQLVHVLPERANLEHIQALILLSFYSHNINRRHSAYNKIGSAMRLAINLGLHHNLPGSIMIDPLMKQHRICLWWTVYVCDRIWASKLGQPLGIQDADISVDMPSLSDVPIVEREELPDSGFIIASIKLARIAGDIINTIYCRNNPPPFVHSVQQILRALKTWVATLPENVRLPTSGGSARYIISLHLSFNQCLILATRPILLYILQKAQGSIPETSVDVAGNMDTIIPTLKEACIHAARHSNELLTQVWIEGTLATFGYFDAHNLFSSAVVLAISCVLDEKSNDRERFDSAAKLIQFMAKNGNLSATEFCGHLDRIKQVCDNHLSRGSITPEGSHNNRPNTASDLVTDTNPMAMNELTTEMVLGQTPMQDFLTQPEILFDFPNGGFLDENHLFFDWSTQV